MKVLGIDPASGLTGVALLDHDNDCRLVKTWVWEKTKSKSDAHNLMSYYDWLSGVVKNPFGGTVAPMACVEFLKVTKNAQTVRKLSHYQAVSVLACKHAGLMVIETAVSSARKEALGKGNLSKEESFALIKKRYPDHEFRRADKGGMDESDAIVLGLAGPGLAEL